MAVEMGSSSKGKPTVIYKNFEYIRERANAADEITWRCRFHYSMKCKARLKTSGGRVVSDRQPEHNHEGNIGTSLARKAVGQMKGEMDHMTATPSSSQATVMANLNHHVLMALPKRATVAQALRRHRLKTTIATNGNVLPAVPTDLMFTMPEAFQNLVQFDSGPGDRRIIMIGCPELLDGLARSKLWLADGTFKVVPGLFFQLYTVHFDNGSGVTPCGIYCLLANKTGCTYDAALREIKQLIPQAAPDKILVDFERAAINSFSAAFPNAIITGCYFHLCQSVTRKVNEVGLKVEYENNDEVRGFIRCLPALAFVPVDDVVEAFEILIDAAPQGVEHLDELISFFEHTYVRGRRLRGRPEAYGPPMFALDTWNQHDAGVGGIARTTNAVEGWHHALQSLFQCHHPTLWTFVSGIQKDMQLQKARFLQATAGVENLGRKKYRKLTERIQRVITGYGQAEILLFLRSIAHLSHV